MASVVLENVNVDFPIYGAQQRSLHKAIFKRATGGSIERNGRNQDRVTVKALTDVSLTLQDGDRLGLIGHNGSGKSTLLKLIAGIYQPLSGRVKVEGRVTPLFDAMPGLDSEDSGYENIITSGMLIGMTRRQIEAKIPEIEEFCELGEYLTLPVRTYSTGMTMRLGFALVTALDPGVLLMDEGFGTGDLRFAERAEARMSDFIGRSQIMVLASHSDNTIRSMCNKAVLMEAGRIVAFGPVNEICDRYYESVHMLPQAENEQATGVSKLDVSNRSGDGTLRILEAQIESADADGVIRSKSSLKITLSYQSVSEMRDLRFYVGIFDAKGTGLFMLDSDAFGGLPNAIPAKGSITCSTGPINLTPGRCYINIAVFKFERELDHLYKTVYFNVAVDDFHPAGKGPPRDWVMCVIGQNWKLEGLENVGLLVDEDI